MHKFRRIKRYLTFRFRCVECPLSADSGHYNPSAFGRKRTLYYEYPAVRKHRFPTQAILRCRDGLVLSGRVSGKSGSNTYENDVSGLAESDAKIQKFVLNVIS